MEDIQRTINRHDRAIAAHTEQIKTLSVRQERMDKLVAAVTVLATKMDGVEKGQTDIRRRIEDLASMPVKNWQSVVTALITGIISAIIGAVVGALT